MVNTSFSKGWSVSMASMPRGVRALMAAWGQAACRADITGVVKRISPRCLS